MKLSRTSWTAFACVLLLGACQQDSKDDAGENTSGDSSDENETPAVPVEVVFPVRGNIYATYSGTAPIEAFAEADIVAKVDGEVRRLLVEEGDTVEKGQILATLDGDRLRLELNESKARLNKLQRDFARNKELQAKGLISEGDFERIQYDLEALQASYNLAKLELDYTQIRSTINGVVSERYIRIGNTIRIGDAVFRVTSLSPLVAYMYVPEREFQQIEAGQPVLVLIDALADEAIEAKVTRVSPVVDPATGTFKTTVEIHDNAARIKPGMFGRINIVYDVHEAALQIPRSAIIDRNGELSVFVIENDTSIRKIIETGFSSDGMVEVLNGLSDSEAIVSIGQLGLKDEAKVVVINASVEDTQ